jgi:hypothetical protein
MIIKITNKIAFQDDPGMSSLGIGNSGSIDWAYDGDSDEIVQNEDGGVTKDFKLTNANKYSWELKHGNNFDVNIQQDLLRGYGDVVSLHAFCYESTTTKPYRLPIRFDVILDDVDVVLASTCDFSLGNIKNLLNDIRISNVQVPINSKATLVIIVATKE